MKYKGFTQDDIDNILNENPEIAKEMDELILWMSYQTPEFMRVFDETMKAKVADYIKNNKD